LGCVSELAADATAGFMADAAPALRAYFDYETAGSAGATGLIQLEGLHHVSPHNARLTLTLAQAYTVYAFSWVMDKQEQALIDQRYEDADRQTQRAYLMYTRAQQLVLGLMRERDPAIDGYLVGDPDRLREYLREEYDDPEDDVELVFWCAVTWGSAIGNAAGPEALIDLTTVKVLAEHVIRLDEGYENAGVLTLLGGFEASYPEQLGGDWKKGKEYFERALRLSHRRNQLHLINYARTYAVNAQDKALFVSLLREILASGDQGDDVRLSNKVARRRAERYLAHIDMWFE
jgi:hypothetical protein